MAEEGKCEQCGAELTADAPAGLCPRCLASMGLDLLPARVDVKSDVQIERTGVMIGRYKLLQKIGEGGFGVVYMAEQVEPVHRKVALKIIKAGMDTKEVIARFEAERQAIALMDHPNIARALDAGATEAGRPYFVMELVHGIPITDYCDQSQLPPRERLQLFIKVCQAVQHAHQKGVIHRDLKPSNVLVTLHDGEPVPKVIDFGVAKALGQRLTEKTLFTAFHHLIGTPAYMSPEQAALSGLDIDTRADIYSLGVLLYELLTGVTPFDAETFRKAGLDEIRRMIRETEPPKPSTRLQTLGQKLPEVAKQRQIEPAALSRLVRGDLDWIVMKCLEKDRKRRYETANGLATDVQRHLDSEPVIACPPSNFYRFQKLVWRNKLAFAASSAVLTALMIGLGISTWSFLREQEARRAAEDARKEQSRLREEADKERDKAETEAAKSRRIAQLLTDMLQGIGPSVAVGRDTTMLREIVDHTAERLDHNLGDQPAVEVDLRMTLGSAYRDLGEYTNAASMFVRALELQKHLPDAKLRDKADCLYNLGEVLRLQGKQSEARAAAGEALRIRTNLFGLDHLDVARSLESVALAWYVTRSARDEALKHTQDALTLKRRLLGNENLEVANSLTTLGLILNQCGRFADAEAAHQEALLLRKRLLSSVHPDVLESMHQVAWSLYLEGNLREAEQLFEETLASRRKVLTKYHPRLTDTLLALGTTFSLEKKYAEAEGVYQEALESIQNRNGTNSPTLASPMSSLAGVLWHEGKFQEAEELYRKAMTVDVEGYGNWHPSTAALLKNLMGVLRAEGKQSDAETVARNTIKSLQQTIQRNPKDENAREDLGHSYWHLASLQTETQRRDEALQNLKDATHVFQTAAIDFPANEYLRQELAFTRRMIGDLLIELHRFEESEELYRSAIRTYAALKVEQAENNFYAEEEAYTSWMLAGHLQRAGRIDGAVAEYRKALALYEAGIRKFPSSDNWKQRRDAVSMSLDLLLVSQGKPPEDEVTHRACVAAKRKAIEKARSEADTGDVQALNELAWLLATCIYAEIRDGRSAVGFAEKAVNKTERKDANLLDTLAAAYAEDAQFEKAVTTQSEAITLLGDEIRKHEFVSRLKLYEARTPYREIR